MARFATFWRRGFGCRVADMTFDPRAAGAALLAAAILAGPAQAACGLNTLAEFPVTVTDLQPLVTARINGVEARFMTDSGAFFSQITPAKAAELGLKPGPAPFGLLVRGVGGFEQKLGFVTVSSFSIAGRPLAGAFMVGGGETGQDTAGVIGQNILGFADVEYDLAHGVIRLMRSHGCIGHELAYWAAGQPFSALDIEAAPARMTYGVAYVNGSRMRVLFDTGAGRSLVTLAAARRAGLDPRAAGVTPAGPTHGLGRHLVRSWIAPVDSFKVGGEAISHTRLRLADVDTGDFDMLLGADFFLSHRVYVANDQRKLYFTYNGGPVFNLDVAPFTPVGGSPAKVAASGEAEPTDAAGFARRGAASASRGAWAKAIADLSRALALAPDDPAYLYERARAYQGNGQVFLAMADLDRSLTLDPADIPALTTRAAFNLSGHDKARALADLASADRLAARQADVRLTLAQLYLRADEPALAIPQLDAWIAAHPDDARRSEALGARCRARGLSGLSLDHCDAATRAAHGLKP